MSNGNLWTCINFDSRRDKCYFCGGCEEFEETEESIAHFQKESAKIFNNPTPTNDTLKSEMKNPFNKN